MIAILTIAVAGVGAFVVLAGVTWWTTQTKDRKAATTFLDLSYSATQLLIKDENVPESVINFTEFFWTLAGRPKLARGIAHHAIVRAFTAESPPLSDEGKALERDLSKLTEPQAEAFAEMIAFGSLASAAADPVFSTVFKNVLSIMLSRSGRKNDGPSVERANTLAVDIARSDRHLMPA